MIVAVAPNTTTAWGHEGAQPSECCGAPKWKTKKCAADDIDAAALVHPSLTTVDNRAYEKGALCGRLPLQRLSGELTGPFRQIVVPSSLVVRESA